MTEKNSKSRATRKPMQSDENPVNAGDASQPYVVLARKYRPQTFEDLIGQNALVQTLQNAFEVGRIAQAYMLTGVRGVGKTTTARILARALNFAKEGAPDEPTTRLPRDTSDFGDHCADIIESRHPDVIEMDAASNTGVDNIREIIESSRYKPLLARYKVFIVDEVHMLSKGAFNALLKTLEEPPEHVKFIFATTEIRKVPVTVLSRCQRFDLRRVDVDDLVKHFKSICDSENAKAESDALRLIARAAEGSVRDGLSILDQAIAFQQSNVKESGVRAMLGLADRGRIFDLLQNILSGNCPAALDQFDALHKDGSEAARVLTDLAEIVHLVTKTKVAPSNTSNDGFSAEEHRRAKSIADKTSVPLLARTWQILLKGIEETHRAPLPQSAASMVLIRLAYTADLPTPDDLIKTLGRQNNSTQSPANAKTSTAQAEPPSAHSELMSQEPKHKETVVLQTPATTLDDSAVSPPPQPTPREPELGDANRLSCFEDILALIANHRDARLKIHLEENTSLVRFDAEARAIDLFLLPQAPKSLANELRERLNEWTGSNWIVMLSKEPGAAPVAEVRRNIRDAEIAQLKTDPTVKAALDAFPYAKIIDVEPLAQAAPDDQKDADDQNGNPQADTA